MKLLNSQLQKYPKTYETLKTLTFRVKNDILCNDNSLNNPLWISKNN